MRTSMQTPPAAQSAIRRDIVNAPQQHASGPTSITAAQRRIGGLSLLIALLAFAATAVGIFTADSQHHLSFVTARGETVLLQGGGLYRYESVSGAAQAIGQDFVTLLIAIPLLLIAAWLALRGSLAGRILQAGALWYFTYTYLLMAFGGAYNPLFLIYVALYSASLFALILSLSTIDIAHLPERFSPRFLRRTIAWLLLGIGIMLTLLWLGRIVPALAANTTPVGLESYSTLFVQAGDLGLVVPLALLAGVFLLRRSPVGYLLAGIVLVKGATLGLALMAMSVSLANAGIAIAPGEVIFFSIVAFTCGLGAIHLLWCIASQRVRTEKKVAR